MTIYEFWNGNDVIACTSLRKALSARAAMFPRRKDRPEILMVDIGKLDKPKACALLMRKGYAVHMEDIA